MVAIEVGRICVKTSGRESGEKCVIVDVVDKNYVLVTGPKSLTGIRRRRVNMRHLQPTEDRVDLKRDATDDEVLKALEKAKKTTTVKTGSQPKAK